MGAAPIAHYFANAPRPRGPAVCRGLKPVGKPDAGNPHVRFDERGRETERCRMAQATAPVLDSTPNEVVKNIGRGQAALKAVDRIPQARAGLRDVLFEILGRLGHFETLLVKTPASRSSDSPVRFGASEVFAIALR